MVIKAKVTGQAEPGFPGVEVFVQIDLFVFNRTPEPLGKDVIQGLTPTIHTDLNFQSLEPAQILGAGKMAALIAVENQRLGLGQGPLLWLL